MLERVYWAAKRLRLNAQGLGSIPGEGEKNFHLVVDWSPTAAARELTH